MYESKLKRLRIFIDLNHMDTYFSKIKKHEFIFVNMVWLKWRS